MRARKEAHAGNQVGWHLGTRLPSFQNCEELISALCVARSVVTQAKPSEVKVGFISKEHRIFQKLDILYERMKKTEVKELVVRGAERASGGNGCWTWLY